MLNIKIYLLFQIWSNCLKRCPFIALKRLIELKLIPCIFYYRVLKDL